MQKKQEFCFEKANVFHETFSKSGIISWKSELFMNFMKMRREKEKVEKLLKLVVEHGNRLGKGSRCEVACAVLRMLR
jgi:hypothetical protein